MTALGEKTLMRSLVDTDSLEVLALEGLPMEVVPTKEFHSIVSFALQYFHDSGRRGAPTVAVFAATDIGNTPGKSIKDVLDDFEINYDADPEETIEWAIQDLRASYVHKVASEFNKQFATAMANAETSERERVLSSYASSLVGASMALDRRSVRIDVREGMADRLTAYELRAANATAYYGMGFGLPEIDNHTYGVHDGELALFAAFAKVGKSYFVDLVALNEWRAGRNVALFTLENPIDMTLDRLGCLAKHVNADLWQRGACEDVDVKNVREWIDEVQSAPNTIHVIQSEPGQRTPEALVRTAQLLGCDSIIIDQLSHIEHGNPDRKSPRDIISEVLYRLKLMISSGREQMPCLLAHQINREGKKAADKIGYHLMEHLAETSAAERVADSVFSGYQSMQDFGVGRILFQTLAARRFAVKNWKVTWQVSQGDVEVQNEVTVGPEKKPDD